MADTADLGSVAARRRGSSPLSGTYTGLHTFTRFTHFFVILCHIMS